MVSIFQTTFWNGISVLNKVSIKISLKFGFYGSNEHYSSIGLDNGLAPTRRQAFIWTNYV